MSSKSRLAISIEPGPINSAWGRFAAAIKAGNTNVFWAHQCVNCHKYLAPVELFDTRTLPQLDRTVLYVSAEQQVAKLNSMVSRGVEFVAKTQALAKLVAASAGVSCSVAELSPELPFWKLFCQSGVVSRAYECLPPEDIDDDTFKSVLDSPVGCKVSTQVTLDSGNTCILLRDTGTGGVHATLLAHLEAIPEDAKAKIFIGCVTREDGWYKEEFQKFNWLGLLNTPKLIRRALRKHAIRTVVFQGWSIGKHPEIVQQCKDCGCIVKAAVYGYSEKHKKSVLQAIAMGVSEIATDSEYSQQLLSSEFPDVHVSVVTNAVPKVVSSINKNEYRKTLGIPASAFVICWVGRFASDKQPERVLKIMEALHAADSDVWGILVGGPDVDRNKKSDRESLKLFKALQVKYAKATWIKFLGQLSCVSDILQVSDILLNASDFESDPVSNQEALQVGLPILGSDIPGNHTSVIPGLTGEIFSLEDSLKDSVRQYQKIRHSIMSYRENALQYSTSRAVKNKERIQAFLNFHELGEAKAVTVEQTPCRVTIGLRFHIGGDEKLLREALDSILAQTYTSYEIFLVIDGMFEDAKALADKYCLPMICTNVKPHTIHMSMCHRILVQQCKTEYYKPLDFDDRIDPDFLKIAVAEMDLRGLGMYCSEARFISWEGVPMVRTWPEYPIDRIRDEDTLTNPVFHPSVLLRTSEIIRSGNYPETTRFYGGEDWDLWIRMMRCDVKMYKNPAYTCSYRVSEKSSRAVYTGDSEIVTDDNLIYRDVPRTDEKTLVLLCDFGLGGVQALVSRQLSLLTEREKSQILIGTAVDSDGVFRKDYSQYNYVGAVQSNQHLMQLQSEYNIRTIWGVEALWWLNYNGNADYVFDSGIRMFMQYHGTMAYQQTTMTEFVNSPHWNPELGGIVVATEYDKQVYTALVKAKTKNTVPIYLMRNIASEYVDQSFLREQTRKTLGLTSTDVCVVFSGRFTPHKAPYNAIAIAIEAHKRNPHIKLVMLGGPDSERNSADDAQAIKILQMCKEQISRAGAESYIQLLGTVDNATVNTILAACDVMLVTSEYESCSMAQISSQLAGLPIVAPNTGANRSVVSPGVTGELFQYHTCASGNPELIHISEAHTTSAVNALTTILKNKDEYSKKAKSAGARWLPSNRYKTEASTLRWILFGKT